MNELSEQKLKIQRNKQDAIIEKLIKQKKYFKAQNLIFNAVYSVDESSSLTKLMLAKSYLPTPENNNLTVKMRNININTITNPEDSLHLVFSILYDLSYNAELHDIIATSLTITESEQSAKQWAYSAFILSNGKIKNKIIANKANKIDSFIYNNYYAIGHNLDNKSYLTWYKNEYFTDNIYTDEENTSENVNTCLSKEQLKISKKDFQYVLLFILIFAIFPTLILAIYYKRSVKSWLLVAICFNFLAPILILVFGKNKNLNG